MGKFNKGLIFGGLLGAGLVWMSTTKKGRELRDKLMDQAADVYADVKRKVFESDAWKTITKQKYITMVTEFVDTYAKNKGLSEDLKETVKKIVVNQWKHLQQELKKKKR